MNRRFIKATKDYCTVDKPIPAPLLRRTFVLDSIPDNGHIDICGLGSYRLFINGREITRGHLAPYISNPDHICFYDSYDITSLLRKGRNAIGIILGNGLMNSVGGYVWDFDKAAFRDAPKVALSLVLKSGEDITEIEADTDFKVHPSPIIFDDLRYGEYYDAREAIEGWALPDFDDSDWDNAITADAPRGEFRLCQAEPIQTSRIIKPQTIIKCKDGYVYDFGINTAGICELYIKNASHGQKLSFRFFEQMRDGEPYIDTVVFPPERFADYYLLNQKNIYICQGGEAERWKPSFTYHGFRYVLVEGITEAQATDELLTYHVMHSELATHGNFKCSDERVNKLFGLAVNSDLSNFYYFPTDCPHREKNGWTGDAATSCFHMMMLYDCSRSFAQWLQCVRKAQDERGAIPGIVPTTGWGYDFGCGPAWDCVAFYLPYVCWEMRGDTQIIKDNAQMMVRYLEYVLTRRNGDGTVSFGLGDWASVGRRSSRPETPLVVTDSIMVMDIAKKAYEMLDAIGHSHSANFAKEIYTDMRRTIREILLNTEECTLQVRTQAGQALGLYYGVFEPNEEQKAFDTLVDIIGEKGDSIDCGMLGLHTIFHVLSRYGKGELAFRMITKKEYPSYGYLLESGETSLIEKFMPNNSPSDSHNHHFFGDISRWFIREIAGLRVENSKKVTLRPDLSLPISYAEAFYELPDGRVSVRWERRDGDVYVEYTCPENVECVLTFPEGARLTRVI